MREDPENKRPVSLKSVPGKVTEKIFLGDMKMQLKTKAITKHGQQGFMK